MHEAALRALEQGRADEAASVIETALERERELVGALRDLSFAIEPVILRDHGFAAAVQALADQVEAARGIICELDVEAGGSLAEKAQVALYQTIREAVGQAVRRQPSRVGVVVVEDAEGHRVRIEDDGLAERRAANVEALRERARIIHGQVSVETRAGRGTTVLVSVPRYSTAADPRSPPGAPE
jgi:signal transduction histidine kinase